MKNPPAVQETRVRPPGREDPLEEGWMPTVVFLSGKSTDGGACMAAVLRVTKRQTQLRLTFEIDVNTRGNQWPSSLPSRKQEINLSCKRVTARIWRWKDPYCQNQGIYGESLYKQTWYFFKLPPPNAKLWLEFPKPHFLFPVNSSQIYCFFVLKNIQAACFGHLLGPITTKPLWTQIKIYFFFSYLCVLCPFDY